MNGSYVIKEEHQIFFQGLCLQTMKQMQILYTFMVLALKPLHRELSTHHPSTSRIPDTSDILVLKEEPHQTFFLDLCVSMCFLSLNLKQDQCHSFFLFKIKQQKMKLLSPKDSTLETLLLISADFKVFLEIIKIARNRFLQGCCFKKISPGGWVCLLNTALSHVVYVQHELEEWIFCVLVHILATDHSYIVH